MAEDSGGWTERGSDQLNNDGRRAEESGNLGLAGGVPKKRCSRVEEDTDDDEKDCHDDVLNTKDQGTLEEEPWDREKRTGISKGEQEAL